MANNVECVRCGQQFDLDAGGIAYQGREGIVRMCEEHIPDELQEGATDWELADEMGVTLRDDDAGIYEDDHEPIGWHDDPQWDD